LFYIFIPITVKIDTSQQYINTGLKGFETSELKTLRCIRCIHAIIATLGQTIWAQDLTQTIDVQNKQSKN